MEEIDIARARLRFHSGVAAAVRRTSGLEWTGSGYRARAKRVVRMEQQLARIPKHVNRVFVLWSDEKSGTVTVEWGSPDGRVFYATVPKIALRRFDRQAGRRAGK
jgi:hypothetical protein